MKNPMPNARSMCVACVKVDDVTAATAKARSLGGKVMSDVNDIKGDAFLNGNGARADILRVRRSTTSQAKGYLKSVGRPGASFPIAREH
jgi:hypothetical protein